MEGPPSQVSNQLERLGSLYQQRAIELHREQLALQQTQAEFDAESVAFQQSQRDFSKTRTLYLESMRQRYAVEIEWRKLLEQKDIFGAQENREQEEIQRLKEQLAVLEETVQKQVSLYGNHHIKRQLYQRLLEKSIKIHQNGLDKRAQKKQLLKDKANDLVQRRTSALEECEQMLADTKSLEETEETQSDDIQRTALQVRAQMSKRSEWRSTLRQAQQAYREAKDKSYKETTLSDTE